MALQLRTETLLVALVAAGAGFGVAYWLRAVPDSETPVPKAETPAVAQREIDPEIVLPVRVAPEKTAVQSIFDDLESQTVLTLLELPTDFLQTAALYALVGRSDVAAIKGHIEQSYKIPKSGDRTAALTIIYLRFSEIDPEGALQHLLDSGYPDRANILFGMFNGWAKYDLDGALERMAMLRRPADQELASRAIMQAHSDASPEVIQQIAGRLPGRDNALSGTASAILAQARTDPSGALAAALAVKDANTRLRLISRIASMWAQSDASAALAFAGNLKNAQERKQFRLTALSVLAKNNPELAFEWLDTLTDQRERQTIVNAAMGSLAAKNPRHAMALAQSLKDTGLRDQAMGNVLMTWAQADVRAAALALEQIEDRRFWDRYGHSIAFEYGKQAPLEALAWAERVEGRRGNLWQNIISSIAQNDPGMALGIVTELPPSPQRSDLLANVLGMVAAKEPWLALEYLEDMPIGSARDSAISQIANQWAQVDPTAALDWLLTQPERTQASALHSIAYLLAQQDLELAAGYAELFDGQAQQSWISAILNQYVQQDLDGALAWIDGYRDHPDYGNWVANIASQVARRDPQAALGVIAGITDPEQLQAAQSSILSAWAQQDPAGAADWLMTLSPDLRDINMIYSVADTWFRYDPAGAQRWVLALSNDAERDAGIMSLIYHDSLSTQEVTALIGQLSSAEQVMSAWQSHVHRIAQNDPMGALELIGQSGLTPAQQAELESIISQYTGG